MKLVFATHNQNKFREIRSILPQQIELLSLDDIDCTEDIAETEETIEGNAKLKADYVKENYGYDCFADDTGLEVEALNGAPGVYSARYAGEPKSDAANLEKLIKKMEGTKNRSAQFKTVISLRIGEEHYSFPGICKGEILKEKRGEKGFGYDPVFNPEGFEKSFAEMDLEEKSEISHRARAFKKLVKFLKDQE